MKSDSFVMIRCLQIYAVLCLARCQADDAASTFLPRTSTGGLATIEPQTADHGNTTLVSMTTKAEHPRIAKIDPAYGPVSGGTQVTISGQDLLCEEVKVQLINGDFQVTLNCSKPSSDALECQTPKARLGQFHVQVLGYTKDGLLQWNTTDPVQFTYKPDPQIHYVYPAASILAGGITQTVVGEHLDSVAHPMMFIENGTESMPGTPCSHELVNNSTVLECRIGVMHLPNPANDSVLNHPDKIYSSGTKVTLGFIFDGFTNHSVADLRMFYDPFVERFDPDTRDFITSESNNLTLKAKFPRMNFSEDDMDIRIGGSKCTNVEIHRDQDTVTCNAPVVSKSAIRYGPKERNTLIVEVSVGNLRLPPLGHLHYVSVEPFHVVIIVMIAILSFIFVVSCTCGFLTICDQRMTGCHRGRSTKPPFRSISSYEEQSDVTELNQRSATVGGELGKRRAAKRGGMSQAKPSEPVECVSMQYQARNGDTGL